MAESQIWDDVWKDADNQEQWTYLAQVIFDTIDRQLRRETPQRAGPHRVMLEAGCGSGRISVRLTEHVPGTALLLDYSPVAVERLQEGVNSNGVDGHVLCGDIFDIPLANNSCDLVWNAGVVEHFTGERQNHALREMLRVLKPGGLMITLNPYAKCLLHTVGKAFVEKVATYPYGVEIPIQSLDGAVQAAGQDLYEKEFSIGFIVLFVGMFKRLMIVPGCSFFRPLYRGLDALFCFLCRCRFMAGFLRATDKLLSRIFGGYLLVTTVKKK